MELTEVKNRNGEVIGYKLSLYSLTFQETGIDELIKVLQYLKNKTNATTFALDIITGYDDDIEDIKLEAFIKK